MDTALHGIDHSIVATRADGNQPGSTAETPRLDDRVPVVRREPAPRPQEVPGLLVIGNMSPAGHRARESAPDARRTR
eukprot:6950417-Prymnesium_polylepis.1